MAQSFTSSSPDTALDPANLYARHIIEDYHDLFSADYPRAQQLEGIHMAEQPDRPFVFDAETYLKRDTLMAEIPSGLRDVAIIGGGIGGLYAGLLLQKAGIPYTIYESSDRVGGRLYTYEDFEQAGPYDYIDMGAMRFPETHIMRPVFELFDDLGLEKLKYYFEDRDGNSTLFYNGVRRKRSDKPIRPSDFNIGPFSVPPKYGNLGVHENMSNVIAPFKTKLKEDAESHGQSKKGWKQMMNFDLYSTKAYMSGRRSDWRPDLDKHELMPYPIKVVEWCETFSDATSSFDRGLSETVLDSLAFEYEESGVDWCCIKGGSSTIAKKLRERLEQKPEFHELRLRERVTAVRYHHDSKCVSVASSRDGQKYEARYGHVITTTTLPALRVMDLSEAALDWPQWTALRSLSYDSSTKIGVKFKTAWWQDGELMKSFGAFGAVVGGQSYSDNMSRRVVYPSYGIDTDTPPTVLMVSYTFGADALPWVGLAGDECAPVVRDRVISDLVAIHGFNDRGRQFLEEQWQEAVLYSWHTNPNTLGAFAMFGPGQFAYLYKHLTRPAARGRMHFAGEVVSVRHAWVVGALEASKRAVETIIRESFPDKFDEFLTKYGNAEAWTEDSLVKQVAITQAKAYDLERGSGLMENEV